MKNQPHCNTYSDNTATRLVWGKQGEWVLYAHADSSDESSRQMQFSFMDGASDRSYSYSAIAAANTDIETVSFEFASAGAY